MNHSLPRQMILFGLVGIGVFAIDYAVFAAALSALPGSHLLANIVGKVAGAVSGFVLHRNITFAGAQRDGVRRQALSYAMLFGFNLALSTALLWLLVDYLRLNAYASRLAVDVLVIISSFVGSRVFVYRAV